MSIKNEYKAYNSLQVNFPFKWRAKQAARGRSSEQQGREGWESFLSLPLAFTSYFNYRSRWLRAISSKQGACSRVRLTTLPEYFFGGKTIYKIHDTNDLWYLQRTMSFPIWQIVFLRYKDLSNDQGKRHYCRHELPKYYQHIPNNKEQGNLCGAHSSRTFHHVTKGS